MAEAFRTTPIKTDKMPPGIPFIIGNEAAERFCFYGLRAVLVIYMTQYLRDRAGALAPMNENEANYWYHLFLASNYFFPMMGAIVADAFWGKYRTVFWISLVYCAGCLFLAGDDTRLGLFLGLGLIALGAGGIKPCVSSNVGDQFGSDNKHLVSRAFGWFYFAVNFGSFFSISLTPVLLKNWGPKAAFGLPAALMLLATLIFWSGRYKFVHVPPTGKESWARLLAKEVFAALGRFVVIITGLALVWCIGALIWRTTGLTISPNPFAGGGAQIAWLLLFVPVIFYKFVHVPPKGKSFLRETFTRETFAAMGRLAVLFVFVAVFWSLWDQSGGEWVLQAEKMDRQMNLFGWHVEVLSSQIQAVNAIMILALIPTFQYVIYPAINAVWKLSPLRKIGLGIFTIGVSFLISAWIESRLTAGVKIGIGWQMPAYLLLSAGEVMTSITALEFAYTQAPKHLKAIVQALYLWSITGGNLFTALVQKFIQNADGTSKLPGASFYLFFAVLAMVAALVFAVIALRYKEVNYLQDEAPAA